MNSSLTRAGVQKILQCLQIGLLGVISLKDISWLRIGWKPNSFHKLSQCFKNVVFHSNFIKPIKFYTFDKFQWKFFKLGKKRFTSSRRRFVKRRVMVLKLYLVALMECLPNLPMVLKWCVWVRGDNKIKSSLIGAVVQKIWECLVIGLFSIMSRKDISWVQIGLKPNSFAKLSQYF